MFVQDTRGTIAITSAVTGLVLFAAIGVGVDTARMVSKKHSLQGMADAAALAATVPEDIADSERETLVGRAVEDYKRQTGETLRILPPEVSIENQGGRVTVALQGEVELLFGGVLGFNEKPVRAEATAEETEQGPDTLGTLATAVSFVVDASSDGRTGESVTLRALRSVLNTELASVRADGTVQTGLFPFNWGSVDGQTSTLQLGSANTLGALNALTSREGSVPAEALEAAIADQQASGAARRYVVLTLDSEIDVNRSDDPGAMIPETEIFGAAPPAQCLTTPPDMIRAQDELAQYLLKSQNDHGMILEGWTEPFPFDDDYVKYDSGDTLAEGYRKRELLLRMSSGILTGVGGLDEDDVEIEEDEFEIPLPAAAVGVLDFDARENVNRVNRENANLSREQKAFEEVCMPVQVKRVYDSCDSAKASGMKVVGVNMSGDHGPASRVTRECVLGDADPVTQDQMDPTAQAIVAALGAERAQVAPDGSIYVVVSSIEEGRLVVRELINTARQQPNASTMSERSVRLVR